MSKGEVLILQSDASRLPLAGASIDLIVTSPPYFSLRTYTDGGRKIEGQIGNEVAPAEYIKRLVESTAEWMRVLKPEGSLFVNLGDKYGGRGGGAQGVTSQRKGRANIIQQARGGYVTGSKSLLGLPWRYALACMDELGLILRAEIIWHKTNATPESVRDRVRRRHEQVFHFVKSRHYYSNGNPPGSVWNTALMPLRVPAELGVEHFAAFPPKLVVPIVMEWSPESGTVLDPMGGTGTTALVACALGRTGISADLSADYCRLAQWRTSDMKQQEKVKNT